MRFARILKPRVLKPRAGQPPREFLRRLDRVAGDLNVVLFIFVIGLATLDFTFMVTQKVVDQLPPATRMVQDQPAPQPAVTPAPVHPAR